MLRINEFEVLRCSADGLVYYPPLFLVMSISSSLYRSSCESHESSTTTPAVVPRSYIYTYFKQETKIYLTMTKSHL